MKDYAILCSIFALLLGVNASSSWGSRSSAVGDYLTPGPDGNKRELINNARCAKVHNNHGPNGWRQRWRPMNIPVPDEFWSTPVGPRSTFSTTPQGVSDDLWTFLGGEVQIFSSFKGPEGIRRAVYGALRCVAHTPIAPSPDTPPRFNHVGVIVVGLKAGAHIVATPSGISEDLDTLHTGWSPIVLGMTPGEPGTVIPREEWVELDFANAPEEWKNFTFVDEITVNRDLRIWSRTTTPSYKIVDGSGVSRDQWMQALPTRRYNETQCLSFLRYEEEEQRRPTEEAVHVAISGLFEGQNTCDMDNSTWTALFQVSTDRRGSPNAIQFPLSIAEGVLLVVIPAVWELLTATTLLFARLVRTRTHRITLRQTLGWLFLEIGSIIVGVGELGLLVHSTLRQLEWQPCWLGRWGHPDDLLDIGSNVTFLGSESDVLNIRSDVVAVACSDDPGTDAKWAIAIGVVLFFHLALLALECCYFTVPRIRKAVDLKISQSVDMLSTGLGSSSGNYGAHPGSFTAKDDVAPEEGAFKLFRWTVEER